MEIRLSVEELAALTPREMRSITRKGEWTTSNIQACRGYVHTNVAIVPKEYAFEFLLFCTRNPRSCPVLDVTELGDPHPRLMAPEADLRTDVPRYKVFKDGELIDEPTDILDYWRDDLAAFLLGVAISFQWVAEAANIRYHLTGSFNSNIDCVPAGPFKGKMVVLCPAGQGCPQRCTHDPGNIEASGTARVTD